VVDGAGHRDSHSGRWVSSVRLADFRYGGKGGQSMADVNANKFWLVLGAASRRLS